MFKLKGSARRLSYAFSAVLAAYSAMSDNPVALRRRIPFRTHRTLDAGNLGAMLLLPTANGAMRQPVARRFYIGVFLAGRATVLLTDWDADTNR